MEEKAAHRSMKDGGQQARNNESRVSMARAWIQSGYWLWQGPVKEEGLGSVVQVWVF